MKAYNFVLSTFAAASVVAGPSQIEFVDFRSHINFQPVEAHRQSPAYAALEDARQIFIEQEPTLTVSNEMALVGMPLQQQLKRKQLEVSRAKLQQVTLRPTVISQQPIGPNKKDHLAELIRTYNEEKELTVTALAEALVEEELSLRQENPENKKSIKTASGKDIVVSKPVQIIAKGLPTKILAASPDGQVVTAADSRTATQASSSRTEYRIRGPITFTGGAALVDRSDEIVVSQIIDGLTTAKGEVNVNEAKYDIFVDDLEGQIQVLVQSRDGQVRALGYMSILDLANKYKSQSRIDGIEIKIRPTVNAISGTVISAASYGKSIFNLADAKVEIADLDRALTRNKKNGLYEDGDIMLPSTAIITAKQDNFWPSISIVESGLSFQTRLFSKSLVEAFLNLVHDKYQVSDAANEGIIWGRVSYGGRPVEGAKVQIVGNDKGKPIYFNGFLPDKSRNMTATRGEFAFSRITASEELLGVSLGEKSFWPVMVPIENKFVFYADLEAQPTRNLDMRSYDAFTLEPRASIAQPLGTQNEIAISAHGQVRIKADTVRGLTFVEAQAGDNYSPIRVGLRVNQSELDLTHLRADWLRGMRDKAQLESSTYMSAVVGFVEGEDYDVIVGSGSADQRKNVIYFDHKGEATNKKHGLNGGGFIIFDLPRGLHTITMIPHLSKKIITQIVYADEFAAHTIRVDLNN